MNNSKEFINSSKEIIVAVNLPTGLFLNYNIRSSP